MAWVRFTGSLSLRNSRSALNEMKSFCCVSTNCFSCSGVCLRAKLSGSSYRQTQQHYLYAPTHLNPTYQYGVTFERGVSIEYGDRAHALISGTASIDNKGQVLHTGDIRKQTQRMWENVEALLAEAHMTFDDVMHNIVYLRDTADYPLVRQMFKARYPHIPTIIALAPVCRPTWLIEMECIAVRQRTNKDHAEF